jgi:spindle assembly abnormal protein 6
MPLILEDECKGLTGFDTQTASTLYWKAIPCLLRLNDREDQTEELTFRILSGVTRQNHNLRVRRSCSLGWRRRLHSRRRTGLFPLHP